MVSTGSSSSDATEPAIAADYVVVVPVFNQAQTIQSVIGAAGAGLEAGLPGLRGGLVVADSGSTDETAAAARAAAAPGQQIMVLSPPSQGAITSLPYHGVPGRAAALRLALEAAQHAGAQAVAVIDATAPDIVTRITRLVGSILAGSYDFAAPAYRGRPFDGILVKGIIRPLFRTCFGLRVRHPTGPEFACSRRLVEHVLQPRMWPPDAGDAGIDLWLATTAASDSFGVCEVALGARAPGSRDDAPDLAETVAQVVGALFREVDRRAAAWQRVRASKPVPILDAQPTASMETGEVDVRRLLEAFRLGCRELSDLWADILPPATILELRRLAATTDREFRLADRVWARIVADFAVGYRQRVIARDHLLRALAPLYLGWAASLMLECERASPETVDARIDRLGESFEIEKAYLISRWRWPERFRPR
jgi:glucosylglycerate synthase